MGRELPRIESGNGATALDHRVDALRIERGGADISPFVDPSKHRTSVDFGKGEPGAQSFDVSADDEHALASVGGGGFRAPQPDRQHRKLCAVRHRGVGGDWFALFEIVDLEPRDLRAPASTGQQKPFFTGDTPKDVKLMTGRIMALDWTKA